MKLKKKTVILLIKSVIKEVLPFQTETLNKKEVNKKNC